ncbi:MAG TPA: hypothetical protein VE010_12355 [Thermoanaerobaculia bacterium]|nr:hypothetical protein [Thermoanaerobaculia bacterium]
MRLLLLIPLLVFAGCRPASLMTSLERIDAHALWPRFDVSAIPLATFDGEKTWLYRHPAPPPEFRRVRDGVFVREGRDPAITANSTSTIGGVLTATLMPFVAASSPRERAGLVVHELFHAFQQKQHPDWSANEADLFVYPLDDAQNLAAQQLELEALRRALRSSGDASACWAAEALQVRRERFARLPPSSAAYERATEINEGLPTYVQPRAAGTPDAAVLPADDFDAGAVRQRAYATGHALARLLDRFSPEWRERLEHGPLTPLDVLLSSALETRRGTCGFTEEERADAQRRGDDGAAAIRASREARRSEFLQRPGWRLVLEAKHEPLWPQRFDPLNVQVVAAGEVLHTRHVKLGNAASQLEVLDVAALTVAAGEHPLFNGVRAVTISGLAEQPKVEERDGVTTIAAHGITARLKSADVSVRLTNEHR